MIIKQLLLFIFTLDTMCMIIPVLCGNKRIKIFIPEHIKHVHHHHVKKVPVYIVTKEKPRVMHASHIEEDYEDGYRKSPKHKSHPEYDDVVIQGIYRGDESHIHEDVDNNNYDYSTGLPQIKSIKPKLPYMLQKNNGKKKNSSYNTVTRHNRLRL
ncbi:uncharacterized protein LOC126839987 [Adelges cooleyi]|uniref:uncharacterized protein LOC126839987 n=1 Tax=Adelges cooleyi TaxID=133065 RepID=UPI00217F5982|nr:uncharacterized protein LOC126839987 [Adelges cooleyi]